MNVKMANLFVLFCDFATLIKMLNFWINAGGFYKPKKNDTKYVYNEDKSILFRTDKFI